MPRTLRSRIRRTYSVASDLKGHVRYRIKENYFHEETESWRRIVSTRLWRLLVERVKARISVKTRRSMRTISAEIREQSLPTGGRVLGYGVNSQGLPSSPETKTKKH